MTAIFVYLYLRIFFLALYKPTRILLLLSMHARKLNLFPSTGPETRLSAIARRDKRDRHGQDPPRERAPGTRQVQDAARDPQGEHQAARRPVREHVGPTGRRGPPGRGRGRLRRASTGAKRIHSYTVICVCRYILI